MLLKKDDAGGIPTFEKTIIIEGDQMFFLPNGNGCNIYLSRNNEPILAFSEWEVSIFSTLGNTVPEFHAIAQFTGKLFELQYKVVETTTRFVVEFYNREQAE